MTTITRFQSLALGFIFAAGLATNPAMAQTGPEVDTLRRAAEQAAEQFGNELNKTSFPDVVNVAIVPFRDDTGDSYVTSMVEAQVTNSPYKVFERNDDRLNIIFEEIAWNDDQADVMNPETIQKFGKVEGVDAVLYGVVWDQANSLWSLQRRVKMTATLADVETGQTLRVFGPIEGEAYIRWTDALTRFWQYPTVLIGVIVVLIILLIIFRMLKKAFRPL